MTFDYTDSYGNKYVFDFISYPKCIEITVYEGGGTMLSSTVRQVKDGKIIWSHWDDLHISIEATRYCDKLAKNLAFA